MEAPFNPPPGLMRAFRQVLVGRGFAFCDEGEREEPQYPAGEGEVGDPGLEPLLLAGVEASSTDNPQQAIGCTLEDDGDSFWSSTGSAGPDAVEYLLYKLKSPLCLVREVHLAVFRASYQFGEPVYPPSHVSFQAGPSPWSLAPPAAKYPVAATDAVQRFPLPADLPVARYLRVNLHGKRQQQLEDLQWYHAVRRVEAYGCRLAAGDVARLAAWTARQLGPPLAPGVLPAFAAEEALRPGCLAVRGDEAGPRNEEGEPRSAAGEPALVAGMQRADSGGTTSSSLSFAS